MPRKINLDVEQLKKLAQRQWSIEEIAAYFECSRDHIERKYSAIYYESRLKGTAVLKDALWRRAMGVTKKDQDGTVIQITKGNDRLLEHSLNRWVGPIKQHVKLDLTDYSDDDLAAELSKRLDASRGTKKDSEPT